MNFYRCTVAALAFALAINQSLHAQTLNLPDPGYGGTLNVSTKLRVTGDGGAVFTGALNSVWLDGPMGAGARMFWNPSKGAFRAGYAAGDEWNHSSVGQYSFAAGYNATASNSTSIALGNNVSSTGGNGSLAIGSMTFASGGSSMAGGLYSTASGLYSFALGYGVQATRTGATALGNNTLAAADFATSMGQSTTANAFGSLVIGRFNLKEGTPGAWLASEPVFVIGNGTTAVPSNAFVVRKNGDVTMTGKITIPKQGDISMGEFGAP